MLKLNSKLQELRMESNCIGDIGAQELARALEVNGTLSELWLLNNGISKEGVKQFAHALKKNTSLRRLSITAAVSRNTAMDDEIDDLKHNHQVRRAIRGAEEGSARLDLADLKLGDSGAITVAEIIEKNHTLLGLNLEHCEIGDEGAARLAKALETNASILEVSLAGNEIGEEGAQRLMEVLKRNQTIYDMDLGGNPLGGGLQHELDDHTSSRVTFGTPSSDCYEKCLSASQRHAAFSSPLMDNSGGQGVQRPLLSGKSRWAKCVAATEPVMEEQRDDEENTEVGVSNADDYSDSDDSKRSDTDEGATSDPYDGDHMSATELHDASDMDSNLSDEAMDIPRETQRPSVQTSTRRCATEQISSV
jgi:Ran GTPase-activating protein (RanGAP) involved in mRNA processing and transport